MSNNPKQLLLFIFLIHFRGRNCFTDINHTSRQNAIIFKQALPAHLPTFPSTFILFSSRDPPSGMSPLLLPSCCLSLVISASKRDCIPKFLQLIDSVAIMSMFLLPHQQLDRLLLGEKLRLARPDHNFTLRGEQQQMVHHLEGEIKKIKEVLVQFKREDGRFYEFYAVAGAVLEKYKTVLCIRLDKKRKTFQMFLSLAMPDGLFFRVQNGRKYNHVARHYKIRVEKTNARMINICLNKDNGRLIAHFPVFYLFNHFLQRVASREQSKLFRIYKEQVQQALPLLERMLREANQDEVPGSNEHQIRKIWENNYRYLQMMAISSHLNETYIETEAEIREKERVRAIDIKKILKNRKGMEGWLPSNAKLYEQCPFLQDYKPYKQQNYQMSLEQLKYIRTMIAMPVQQRNKNPFQNNMVLNHIFINNVSKVHYNKINQGGFSEIYISEIDYQYVYSSEGHERLYEEDRKGSATLHKYVIVKKDTDGGDRRRNGHEIQILKCIKNGLSIFLPKYYIAINKDCFFSEAVVMDFIPFKNLKEYLRSNSHTISMLTKLYLIFSITQSLRYIRDYRIVHLDLKPNNIMIYCNLLIKLIDFGESYHPDVCEAKHRPGYTLPYSSPEVYNQHKDHYNAKSDVYSLGVIIYEVLYGAPPFHGEEETDKSDQLMLDPMKKWYFMPEELEAYGEPQIHRMLNNIVTKCLAPRAIDRPELDWIALIVRQCFQLLN